MPDVSEFVAGFRRFQKNHLGKKRRHFEALVLQGQHPRAMVVACCDSRSDPAIITDCDPGDMFVVRNVANLVPPYIKAGGYSGVSSALEFGVCNLGVEHIIVLGHAQCGGIRALLDGGEACPGSEFIGKWLSIAGQARAKVLHDLPNASPAIQAKACEQGSVLLSLENLMSYPWIRDRVAAGQLTLHGWYFDLKRGELLGFNPDASRYQVLVANSPAGLPIMA